MVVQTNFIILLALESTSVVKDVYNVFPPPLLSSSNVSSNATDVCVDGPPGVSVFSIILLPFYYAPLLLFFVVAVVQLILFIR